MGNFGQGGTSCASGSVDMDGASSKVLSVLGFPGGAFLCVPAFLFFPDDFFLTLIQVGAKDSSVVVQQWVPPELSPPHPLGVGQVLWVPAKIGCLPFSFSPLTAPLLEKKALDSP